MNDPLNNGFAFFDYQRLAEQIAQIKATARQISDTKEALSLVKRADSALARIEDILGEMQVLATRAALNDNENRADLDKRFQQLKNSMDAAVLEADYGGFNLLDGSLGSLQDALAALEKALDCGEDMELPCVGS